MSRTHQPEGRTQDWYDFPSWYDILHTPGTADEVDGLERTARRFLGGRTGAAWLEPACGSGRYLRVAAQRGRRVVGLDLNAAMIDYARARSADAGRRTTLMRADMTDFELPPRLRADFAFCLINTVRHLHTDRAMLAHLACMARALRPGGVYALGLSLTAYGREYPSEDVWVGVRGRCRVHQLVQFEPPTARARMERVITHLTVTTPGAERHVDSTYWLRAYSGAQWAALLDRSAMELVAVVDERGDDHPCPSVGLRVSGALPFRGWNTPGASGYAIYILRPRAGRRVSAESAPPRAAKFPHAGTPKSR